MSGSETEPRYRVRKYKSDGCVKVDGQTENISSPIEYFLIYNSGKNDARRGGKITSGSFQSMSAQEDVMGSWNVVFWRCRSLEQQTEIGNVHVHDEA